MRDLFENRLKATSNRGGSRANAGRSSGWGLPKGSGLKAIKLPIVLVEKLQELKKNNVSAIEVIKRLSNQATVTSTDTNGLEYDTISPVELASLKNELAKYKRENKKLVKNCDTLLDKLEIVANTQADDGQVKTLEAKNQEFVEANIELATLNSDLVEEAEDSKQTIAALKGDIEKLETDLVNLQSKQTRTQTESITIDGVCIEPAAIQTALVEWDKKVESGKGPRWKNMKTFWSILKGVGK
ncbi:hypothetical protein QUF74_05550 [Candidatus Halobeggiatoa sp. HSG11]|nr:hypothetical protein [Candidatus Halobeggiatoa sp. HSG11]